MKHHVKLDVFFFHYYPNKISLKNPPGPE